MFLANGMSLVLSSALRMRHVAYALIRGDLGAMNMEELTAPIVGLVIGLVFIVLGLILANTAVDQAATTGADAQMGSFSGAQSMNDLQPFLFYVIITVGAITMVGSGLVAGYKAFR